MTKPKPEQPQPPRRGGLKYLAIPRELWERLKRYADADERSINSAAKKAIKDYLDRMETQQP